MVWYLTKANHKLSINPWVRMWLRSGVLGKILITLVVMTLIGAVAAMLGVLGLATSSRGSLLQPSQSFNFFSFLAVLVGLASWGPALFLIVDLIMDSRRTRADIERFMSLPDIVLATRGEYIGGHPKLPHGRFVYLTLGGMLENPQLNIVFPQTDGGSQTTFSMPVLDLQKATERVEKTGDETTVDVMLANVTFQAKFIGQQALLKIEYSGQAGRKHFVEVGHFLFGDGEVQDWRNYIVCIQAEADTGETPYGPWKTLPSGQAQ